MIPPPRRTLTVLGVLAFAALCLTITLRLPIFSPLDELYHFDNCLKLARGQWPDPRLEIEPDLLAFGRASYAENQGTYTGETIDAAAAAARITPIAYQAYHPPLFYLAGAIVLKPVLAAGGSFTTGVIAIRILCALLAIAARVLVFLTVARLGRLAAWAALPYLLFMVPVDLLRVSNDSLVAVLGAAVFWLLLREGPKDSAESALGVQASVWVSKWLSARRRVRLIGLLLALAVLTKTTAVIFLLPAVALCLFFADGAWGYRPRDYWGAIFGPAVVAALGLAILNLANARGLTGTSHLANGNFPPPQGFRFGLLVPTAESWVQWNSLLLLIETVWHGRRGAELYSLARLVTLEQVGLLVALGMAVAGGSVRRRAALGWTSDIAFAGVRRITFAAWLTLLYMLVMTGLMAGVLGRVFWSARQYAPVEFIIVAPAALGWAWLLAGRKVEISPDANKPVRVPLAPLRVLLWLGASYLFARATWPYLAG